MPETWVVTQLHISGWFYYFPPFSIFTALTVPSSIISRRMYRPSVSGALAFAVNGEIGYRRPTSVSCYALDSRSALNECGGIYRVNALACRFYALYRSVGVELHFVYTYLTMVARSVVEVFFVYAVVNGK